MAGAGSTHTMDPGDAREAWNKKNIVERFVHEALDQGLLDVVDETRGQFAEQSKRRIIAWRTAFPDFSTSIEQVVAEGDWIAFRLRHSGTHRGEYLGVAPTGRRVEFTTMVFNRIEAASWSRTGGCTTTRRSASSSPTRDAGATRLLQLRWLRFKAGRAGGCPPRACRFDRGSRSSEQAAKRLRPPPSV